MLQTRRTFLRTGTLAFAGTALRTASPAPDFTFAVLTDLHYRDTRCAEWFHQVLTSLRALHPRPAFLVLAGDLSEDGRPEQLGAVNELFRTMPCPVHRIIGNHDYTR